MISSQVNIIWIYEIQVNYGILESSQLIKYIILIRHFYMIIIKQLFKEYFQFSVRHFIKDGLKIVIYQWMMLQKWSFSYSSWCVALLFLRECGLGFCILELTWVLSSIVQFLPAKRYFLLVFVGVPVCGSSFLFPFDFWEKKQTWNFKRVDWASIDIR